MPLKYTKEVLQKVVSDSSSIREVLQRLGFSSYSGSMSNHIRPRITLFGIDTGHFKKGMKGKISSAKKSAKDILHASYGKRAPTFQLRRALLEFGVPHICAQCGQPPTWHGNLLVLDIDHKDGDYKNNTPENLRFLCPNCHSQTKTFGRRTKPVCASGDAVRLSSG